MKYILDNSQITDFPVYKEYKHYIKLTEDEQSLISKEQKEYALCYYCIENNKIFHVARERQDFLLSDNCRIATQKEIDKYELENLREAKLNELNNFENSNECYVLTLLDNSGNLLTQHDKWLHTLIAPFVAFFDSKRNVVAKELSLELIGKIKGEMNKKSFATKGKWKELQFIISQATKTQLKNTDYIQILKDMPREINIDLL